MITETKRTGVMPLIIVAVFTIGMLLSACGDKPKGPSNANAKKPALSSLDPSLPTGATPPNMLGSPMATVTVEEFADFQCPSCGDKFPVLKQVQSYYGSRIKFIFRNFPLQMHDKAYDAATAAEAAGMQGKFWEMENLLYTNQKVWSVDPNYRQVWTGYAQQIGIDVEKWKTDALGLAAKKRVDDDKARAQALQINSTPTVYINGKQVAYPDMTVDTLQKLIDSELANAGGAKPAAAANSGTTDNANSQK